jgi:TolA-binding protein
LALASLSNCGWCAQAQAIQGQASLVAAEAEGQRQGQRVEELTRQVERAMQEVDVKQSRLEALNGEVMGLRHTNEMEHASEAAR